MNCHEREISALLCPRKLGCSLARNGEDADEIGRMGLSLRTNSFEISIPPPSSINLSYILSAKLKIPNQNPISVPTAKMTEILPPYFTNHYDKSPELGDANSALRSYNGLDIVNGASRTLIEKYGLQNLASAFFTATPL
jgi:hypothetical protein